MRLQQSCNVMLYGTKRRRCCLASSFFPFPTGRYTNGYSNQELESTVNLPIIKNVLPIRHSPSLMQTALFRLLVTRREK